MNHDSALTVIVKIGPKVLRGNRPNCRATLQISVTEDDLIIHARLYGRNVSATSPLPPEVWELICHELSDAIDAVNKAWPRARCSIEVSPPPQAGWPRLEGLLNRLRNKGVSVQRRLREEPPLSAAPDQIMIRFESIYRPHWGGDEGHSIVAAIDSDGSIYFYREGESPKSFFLPTGYALGDEYLLGKIEFDRLVPLANCISRQIWHIPGGVVGGESSAGIHKTINICIGAEQKTWENKADWGEYSEPFGELLSDLSDLLNAFKKTLP